MYVMISRRVVSKQCLLDRGVKAETFTMRTVAKISEKLRAP